MVTLVVHHLNDLTLVTNLETQVRVENAGAEAWLLATHPVDKGRRPKRYLSSQMGYPWDLHW